MLGIFFLYFLVYLRFIILELIEFDNKINGNFKSYYKVIVFFIINIEN